MKNAGVVVLGLLLLVASMSAIIVSAAFNSPDQAITVAYQCLVNATNRTGLSLEEAVFTTLALGYSNLTRDVFDAEKSTSEMCWPKSGCNLKRTAQVALAYEFTERNTSEIEKWIISKNASATGIEWFLEVDVQNQLPATCTVREDIDTAPFNTFSVGTDQKLSGNPGSCFTFARDSYLLKVSDNCLEKSFEISCNEDFLTTMIYKKSGSETYYISSESHTAVAEGSTTERVGARCFKTGTTCDYEGSLWAAVALQQMGRDVTPFVPYILALSDDVNNRPFLPQAFAYILTESSESYSDLTQSQQQNRYWRAVPNNSRLFDTALALQALQGTNAQEATRAKNYLLEIQDNNGCWNNYNVRDTAFILAAAWPQPNLPVYNEPGTGNVTGPGLGLIVNTPVQNAVYNVSVPVNLVGQNSTSVNFSIDNSPNVIYATPVSIALNNGSHTLRAYAFNSTSFVQVNRTFNIANSPMISFNCTNSSQCASGYVCQNNFCISNVPGVCTNDAQCGLGRACQGGSCVNLQLCTSGAQCTSGICTNGVCNGTNSSTTGGGGSGRPRPIGNASTNTTGRSACEIAGFSCGSAFACLDAGGILKSGYSCTGRLECCSVKPTSQQSCSTQQGMLCSVSQRCDGASGPASDGSCCFGSCIAIADEDESPCEAEGYGVCSASCSDNEYDSGYACSTPGFTCCSPTTGDEEDEGGSSLWGWIIFLVILIGLIVAAIVYREKIKLWWFKMQNKSAPKGPGPFGSSPSSSILPRRPPQFGGFLPPRPQARPLARPGSRPSAPQRPGVKPQPKDKELEETLKKLKEMSE